MFLKKYREVPLGDIRGGGVSILVRSLNKNIIAQQLATIQQQDDTTEIIRVRLFWWNPSGLTTIEINNIYRPPISSNENYRCRGIKQQVLLV